MKQKILSIFALLALTFMPATALTGTVYAACGTDSSSKGQVLKGVGQTDSGSDCEGKGVMNAISTIVQILSVIVGAVAIIMIITSGLKYITSGGEGGKVASAKNTLLYALIGLIVAALAQLLVQFVINNSSVATTCEYNKNLFADDPKCVKP